MEWTGTAVDKGLVFNSRLPFIGFPVSSPYTLAPVFELIPDQLANLTISSSGGGTVTEPGEGPFTRPCNTLINIVATHDPNYRFKEWTGSAVDEGIVEFSQTKNASIEVRVHGDFTLEAHFEPVP